MNRISQSLTALALLALYTNLVAVPLGSEFTYQGQLEHNNSPASGEFDFEFRIFDVIDGGTELSPVFNADDLTVTDGIFSTAIDFGDASFLGERIYLEIAVREGVSTGAYTLLTPRHEITSAPYALHAQFVGENAVGTNEIDDGMVLTPDIGDLSITTAKIVDQAITLDKLADNAVMSSSIIDNSIGSSDVNSNQLQLRVTGNCPSGQSIRSILSDGTVTCELDDVGSVTANSVGSNEVIDASLQSQDLASNSVTRDQMADDSVASTEILDGSIGVSDINDNQVQRRITGTCPTGMYLSGINANGTVQCMTLANVAQFTVLDNPGIVGLYTDISIRQNGLAIISYYDATNGDLKIFDCDNDSCTSGTDLTIDSIGDVGQYTSMGIRDDGLPIISYYDVTNGDLKVYDCQDTSCTSGLERTLDSAGNVGQYTSLVVRDDGLPVIAYYDVNNADLKLFDCTAADCSNGPARTLDSSGDVGSHASITTYPSGTPIVSYYDSTNGDLKFYRCLQQVCSSGFPTTLVSAGNVGIHSSIASRFPTGRPVISYYSISGRDLEAYDCDNSSCSSGSVYKLEDNSTTAGTSNVGRYSSITLRENGLPMIAYFQDNPINSQQRNLKIYDCANESCSAGSARILDGHTSIRSNGRHNSIAIRENGLPIISYYDAALRELKVYSCADSSCLLPTSSP